MRTTTICPTGRAIAGRPHLVIPHTFDANDSRLQRGGDFATGEEFFIYCRDAFDWLYRKGAEGQPRMMTISLHGRIIGRPGRIGALARILEHIRRHDCGLALQSRRDCAALDRASRAALSAPKGRRGSRRREKAPRAVDTRGHTKICSRT